MQRLLLQPSIARRVHCLWSLPPQRLLAPSLLVVNTTCRWESMVIIPGGGVKKKKKKKAARSWNPSYKFVDRCRLRVQGGRGGKGSLSMEKLPRKKRIQPDGGNGGSGGSVVLMVSPNDSYHTTSSSLALSQNHIVADNGVSGSGKCCHGAKGKNTILRVPPGVIVKRVLEVGEEYDKETGMVMGNEEDENQEPAPSFWWEDDVEEEEEETTHDEDANKQNGVDDELGAQQEFEKAAFMGASSATKKPAVKSTTKQSSHDSTVSEGEEDSFAPPERRVVTLADLDQPGAYLVVARGGRGGIGTNIFTNNRGNMPPAKYIQYKSQPQEGEVAFLELELKLIADVGLVGFPNAGKSSLLRALSAATPAVAPYPFTTLHPLLGCVEYRDGVQVLVADIPGLIDGASEGRGKGIEFLRHVERTQALLYIVDVASVDFRDPIRDLEILVAELASYGGESGGSNLMERKALVVGNKIDLLHHDRIEEVESALRDTSKSLGLRMEHDVLMISAGVSGVGLADLSGAIRDVGTRERDPLFESEPSAIQGIVQRS